jgi:hypothetical protein
VVKEISRKIQQEEEVENRLIEQLEQVKSDK